MLTAALVSVFSVICGGSAVNSTATAYPKRRLRCAVPLLQLPALGAACPTDSACISAQPAENASGFGHSAKAHPPAASNLSNRSLQSEALSQLSCNPSITVRKVSFHVSGHSVQCVIFSETMAKYHRVLIVFVVLVPVLRASACDRCKPDGSSKHVCKHKNAHD
jgi:hypothetical protein